MSKAVTALRLLHRRFVQHDREAGFLLLYVLGDRLCPGYYFDDPKIDWWDDPEFVAYLDRFHDRRNLNARRRFMVAQLVRLIRDVPGDTAECGVLFGAGSWLIANGTRGAGRTHHGFDSFEGLSMPGAHDGDHWSKGDLAAGEERAQSALAEFGDSVRLYKGWIPERFAEVSQRRFAFVHIDVDLEDPTRESIEFFYDRLEPGAILVCDDYGYQTCPGATKAMDEFLSDKPEKMITLAAGAGFFLKGVGSTPSWRGGS